MRLAQKPTVVGAVEAVTVEVAAAVAVEAARAEVVEAADGATKIKTNALPIMVILITYGRAI